MSIQTLLEKGTVIKFEFERRVTRPDKMEFVISLGEKFFTIKVEASTEDEEWIVKMVGRQYNKETEQIPLNQSEIDMIAEFALARRKQEIQKPIDEIRNRWLE